MNVYKIKSREQTIKLQQTKYSSRAVFWISVGCREMRPFLEIVTL